MSQTMPQPADMVERFGHLPDHRYRGGNEHSSACPKCGGGRGGREPSDRFRFWVREGQACNFWCRRCGFDGFSDDNKQTTPPSPERMAALDSARLENAERESARIQSLIERLQIEAYWRGFHEAMGERQRQMWRDQGIADSLQNYYQLGYTDQFSFYDGNDRHQADAMTIPVFEVGWEAVNVQYRIVDPPAGVGKYRFTAGLPVSLFLTDPSCEPANATLVVEGAKKGIVLYSQLPSSIVTVAVPSKQPPEKMIARLEQCDPVYIGLDPDAYTDGNSAKRLAAMLGARARFVRFPAKPDDLIVEYGFTGQDIMDYINSASRVMA